jgi:putative glutamine amidotransferase
VGLTAIPVVAVTFDVNELEEFVLWREMFRGFVAVGIAPIHTDAEGVPAEALMQRVEGLIISGGSDVDPARYGGDVDDPLIDASKPARDHNELRMLAAAREHGKPVLAICRGVQLLNVACGGSLIADVARDVPDAVAHRRAEEDLIRPLHAVTVEAGSRLAQWTVYPDHCSQQPASPGHRRRRSGASCGCARGGSSGRGGGAAR